MNKTNNDPFEEKEVLTRKKDKKGNPIKKLIRVLTRSHVVCEVCNKPLTRAPGQHVRFCSKKCRLKRHNKKGGK